MLRAFCPLQAAARRYHNMRVDHPPWVEVCIPMSGRTRLQKMKKGKATARLSSSSPHQKISQPNITFHRNLGFLEDGGRLLRASVMPSGSFGATKGKVSRERTFITSAFPCGSPGGNRLARRGPVRSSGPHPGLNCRARYWPISLSKAEARFQAPSSSATWRATSQVSNSAGDTRIVP